MLGSGIVVFIVLIFFIILLIANIIALGRIVTPPTVNGLNVQTNSLPGPVITPGEAQALLWFNIVMLVIVFILLIYMIYIYATTPTIISTPTTVTSYSSGTVNPVDIPSSTVVQTTSTPIIHKTPGIIDIR